MQPFLPDFVLVKMDAEIGSYQEDQDSDRESPDAAPAGAVNEPVLGETDA